MGYKNAVVALLIFLFPAVAAAESCSLSDIAIKSMRVRFVDDCARGRCAYLRGIAVLRNGCRDAVGVQVKITGYDRSGAPVATRELWPASITNIPPGDYEFSLDHYLDFDPNIKTFSLRPVAVQRWR